MSLINEHETYPLQLFIWQADTVLHTHLIGNASVLAENGDALHLDSVLDYALSVAVDRHRSSLDTGPCANPGVPAYNAVENARVMLDLDILEDDTLLDTNACTDDCIGANGNVGTNLRRRVNLCRGVDEYWGNDIGGRLRELGALVLPGLL